MWQMWQSFITILQLLVIPSRQVQNRLCTGGKVAIEVSLDGGCSYLHRCIANGLYRERQMATYYIVTILVAIRSDDE